MEVKRKKLKLCLSDLHLGRGRRLPNGNRNALEDFFHDERFREFLEYYTSGPYSDHEVELILNGDILNLIQTDYHGHYTAVITEHVSVVKLKAIIQGHPIFFRALQDFLKVKHHVLTYVIGNHDQEMYWKSTRALVEETVGREVNWKNTHYQIDGVHIEHGHQYEAVNRVDAARPFLTEGLPEPILNLPWGTLFTIQFIVRLKQQRPAVDKVRPFSHLIWWSLVHDTGMALRSLFGLIAYFISTRFSKNRFRQANLKMTLRMLREMSVFPDLEDSAKRILRSPSVHTVIFGHTHVYKQVQVGENKQYINTGTWNDIISMDLETFARRTKLVYVRFDYDSNDETATCLLRHWIGRIPMEDDALAI